MVNDVEVGDAVKEEVAHPTEEIAVKRCCSTTRERPFLAAVMGQLRVGVVEVGDHDEPVIHAEPRDTVVLDDVSETVLQRCELYGVDHCEYSYVGYDDDVALALGEDDSVC